MLCILEGKCTGSSSNPQSPAGTLSETVLLMWDLSTVGLLVTLQAQYNSIGMMGQQ